MSQLRIKRAPKWLINLVIIPLIGLIVVLALVIPQDKLASGLVMVATTYAIARIILIVHFPEESLQHKFAVAVQRHIQSLFK